MKHTSVLSAMAVAMCSFLSAINSAKAQGTAFTYQGRLNDANGPAKGTFALRFALFDAASAGRQQGNLVTNSPTCVTNGLFTAALDFGNHFPGANRWLEIAVRTNGGTIFSVLAPRQALTSTPYAINAANAATVSGSVAAAQLTGSIPLGQLPVNLVTNGACGVNFSGSFTGNGAGLTNVSVLAANITGMLRGDGQAFDNKALAGQNWGAMKSGWTVLFFAPYASLGVGWEGESCILSNVNRWVTNGSVATITNRGNRAAIMIDNGWQGNYRNTTDWTYNMTNWGSMTWNTNKFPHGIPWLVSAMHSNGVAVIMQFNCFTNITPVGASEIISDINTGLIQPWTNGVGTFPTNSQSDYIYASTPDTASHDISQMYFWGVDGFTANTTASSYTAFLQMAALYGNACLRVSFPRGFNQAPGFDYYHYNPASIDYGMPFAWVYDIDRKNFFQNPMAYIAYETLESFTDHTHGNSTAPYHTGVYYDNAHQGQGAAGLRSILRDFVGTKFADNGAYVVWLDDTTTNGMIAQAISSGISMVHGDAQSSGSGWNTPFMSLSTNAGWQAVHDDGLQAMPRAVASVATGTSIFVKSLANGNSAAAIYNEADYSTNCTVRVDRHKLFAGYDFVRIEYAYCGRHGNGRWFVHHQSAGWFSLFTDF